MKSTLILAAVMLTVIKSNAGLTDYLKDSNSIIIKATHLEAEKACLALQLRLPTTREVLEAEGLKIIETKYPGQSFVKSDNQIWIFEEWQELYKSGFITLLTFNPSNYFYDKNAQFDLQNSFIQFYYNATEYIPKESSQNYWTADTHHISENREISYIYFHAEPTNSLFPSRLSAVTENDLKAVRCFIK